MQYSCVTIPPAVRPTLLRQMDMGSLTCAHIWMPCRTHEGGDQAQTGLHKSWLGGINKKLPFTLPRQGIEPWVFGFESPTLTLTTEPRPPALFVVLQHGQVHMDPALQPLSKLDLCEGGSFLQYDLQKWPWANCFPLFVFYICLSVRRLCDLFYTLYTCIGNVCVALIWPSRLTGR